MSVVQFCPVFLVHTHAGIDNVTRSGKMFAQMFEIVLRISFENGVLAIYVGKNHAFIDLSVHALYI